MIQLTFLDQPARARRTDPEPSHTAARSLKPRMIESLVLHALRKFGPMTSHEIAALTGLELVTVSPRLKPLEERGLVRRGEVRERRTVWSAI